jgi:hypothetical protein
MLGLAFMIMGVCQMHLIPASKSFGKKFAFYIYSASTAFGVKYGLLFNK